MTIAQIEKMVDRLPEHDQVRLVRRLAVRTWKARFAAAVTAIRRKMRRRVTDEDVRRIVEEVRAARYASGRH